MKRFVAIALATALLLCLVAGTAWAYNAKVWLMNDYRLGYDMGADHKVTKDDPQGSTYCWWAANEIYDQQILDHEDTDDGFPESATADYVGCWAGGAGEDNDFWHVAGYLDD